MIRPDNLTRLQTFHQNVQTFGTLTNSERNQVPNMPPKIMKQQILKHVQNGHKQEIPFEFAEEVKYFLISNAMATKAMEIKVTFEEQYGKQYKLKPDPSIFPFMAVYDKLWTQREQNQKKHRNSGDNESDNNSDYESDNNSQYEELWEYNPEYHIKYGDIHSPTHSGEDKWHWYYSWILTDTDTDDEKHVYSKSSIFDHVFIRNPFSDTVLNDKYVSLIEDELIYSNPISFARSGTYNKVQNCIVALWHIELTQEIRTETEITGNKYNCIEWNNYFETEDASNEEHFIYKKLDALFRECKDNNDPTLPSDNPQNNQSFAWVNKQGKRNVKHATETTSPKKKRKSQKTEIMSLDTESISSTAVQNRGSIIDESNTIEMDEDSDEGQ